MHRILKRYLKFFIDNLMIVIDKIELMLINQYNNYFVKFVIVKKDVA